MRIEAELGEADGSLVNAIWTFGGNTCHAPLWFRPDLQHHLRIVREQLGFRHIRAHGTIGDGMQTVRADGSFDFSRVCDGLAILLDLGFKPFIELSHMPAALARADHSITYYQFRSDPPANWSRWLTFMRQLMAALVERFGIEELRTWYFEVWNEPDIAFWAGTMQEYFKLYDLAAQAVKEADPQLRLGGPATARTRWIDEFLAHVRKPSDDFTLDGVSRCDFIATHAYPSDLEFLDAAQGAVTLSGSQVMLDLFTEVRRKVDAALGPGFPVICGEWNSSAGPLAENHDHGNNGAFIVKTMVELAAVCQGSLVWNISDIYEECQFHYEPFHGGYGQLTVNDLPKAGFHAFEFLRHHEGGRHLPLLFSGVVEGDRSVGGLASDRDGQTTVTLYHYQEPDAEPRPDAHIRLQGVQTEAQLRRVLPGAGSAYETWIDLGRPAYVNQSILSKLIEASVPQHSSVALGENVITLPAGSIASLTWRG